MALVTAYVITMLEILLLAVVAGALSKRARAKGRSGAWGAVLLPLYFGGVTAGFLAGGVALYVVAAAVAIFVACAVVELLPATADASLGEIEETGAGQPCPDCGSMQTEFSGGRVVCFSCDNARVPTPMPVFANSPNSPFV